MKNINIKQISVTLPTLCLCVPRSFLTFHKLLLPLPHFLWDELISHGNS